MKPKFIFDLSEVLIMGLLDIEKPLSPLVNMPENEILPCFGEELLQRICRGEISEDTYLQKIIEMRSWQIELHVLKTIIRKNFHREVAGTQTSLEHLLEQYEVILLSDHAIEWVSYIKEIHTFFDRFNKVFFSYELGSTKRVPETFKKVLQQINCTAQDCWPVDDSVENISVAASTGRNRIQFENADQLRTVLKENVLW